MLGDLLRQVNLRLLFGHSHVIKDLPAIYRRWDILSPFIPSRFQHNSMEYIRACEILLTPVFVAIIRMVAGNVLFESWTTILFFVAGPLLLFITKSRKVAATAIAFIIYAASSRSLLENGLRSHLVSPSVILPVVRYT